MEETILVCSDLHCGSPVGLMPPKQFQLRSANVTPTKQQRNIWKQFKAFFDIEGPRTVIFDGDLVEGVHHNNKQITTQYMQEQEQIAIEAIDRVLKKDDRVYFVDGSAVHADESEERIARDFSAYPFAPPTRYTWPSLKYKTAIGELWVAHKGPGTGEGANEGNSLRNKVKQLMVEEIKFGRTPPRMVVFAHRHIKTHVQVDLGNYHADAWILPPFCAKSEFGFGVSPFSVTQVGGLVLRISDRLEWEWKVTDV